MSSETQGSLLIVITIFKKVNYILPTYTNGICAYIPKERTGGMVKKFWSSERPKLSRTNTKSYSSMSGIWGFSSKGLRWLSPSSFAAHARHFSFGLLLLPVHSSLGQMPHNSGIPNILALSWQTRLHFHRFTQWPLRTFLQQFQHSCSCLASLTLWNHGGRIHDSRVLPSFMPPKPAPHGQCGQVWLQLGMLPDPFESHYISFCMLEWSGVSRSKHILLFPFTSWKLSRMGSCPAGTLALVPVDSATDLFNSHSLGSLRAPFGCNIKVPGAFTLKSPNCMFGSTKIDLCSFKFIHRMKADLGQPEKHRVTPGCCSHKQQLQHFNTFGSSQLNFLHLFWRAEHFF